MPNQTEAWNFILLFIKKTRFKLYAGPHLARIMQMVIIRTMLGIHLFSSVDPMQDIQSWCFKCLDIFDDDTLKSRIMNMWLLAGLGMAMGRGGAEGWDLRPRPAWIFLAPSPPLKAPRSPTLHRKPLFLVNFPYNYYHFFK